MKNRFAFSSLHIVGIIIAIIAKVANFVPGVGFLNRVLGLCLGALKIVLVLWGLFYGLSFLSTIPAIGDKVNEFVNSTLIKGPVGKFIYENNILIGIIEKLFNK